MRKLLEGAIGKENVLTDEPMKNHSTFKIGGTADLFLLPQSMDDAIKAVSILKSNDFPFLVLGNGSNLLVGDRGIRGAVLCLAKADGFEVNETNVYADAGITLARLANEAAKRSLTGLEFAAGIPGTLGGGVVMNAGAYGGELCDVITRVRYLDEAGKLCECGADECDFAYRSSRFQDGGLVVVGCDIKLSEGNESEIRARMLDLKRQRSEKQPLDKPSAGSAFKRPEGYFAAKLIDDCGLRGVTVGGAGVSEKHTGFIVNNGDATAADVRGLIEYVQKTVFEKTGVSLTPEIRFVGEF